MTALLTDIAFLPILDVTSNASTSNTITFDFAGIISADFKFNSVVIGFVEDYLQATVV